MTIPMMRRAQHGGVLRFVAAAACTMGLACSTNGANSSGTGGSTSGATMGASSSGAGADGAATTQAGSSQSSASGDASADQSSGSASDASGDVSHTRIFKIMALGDSITRATCWRAQLWQQLNQSFPARFHLVGTLNSDNGCAVTGYETANQGYSSSLVTEVVAGVTTARTCDPFCPALSDLSTAFSTVVPDVVLMHYGTNDVWNGISATNIVSAYAAVVDAMRSANPNVIVLVAQIIPMHVTTATCSNCSCAGCPTAVPALNAAIATWAPTKSTAASPIIVVDQYTGFDAVADTRDGVHPNDTTGSTKMATKWFAALMPLF